ncbi:polyprotein [Sea buckthorn marafivirus]|nr:polyprotein [Sea buckthorn marafivirus]
MAALNPSFASFISTFPSPAPEEYHFTCPSFPLLEDVETSIPILPEQTPAQSQTSTQELPLLSGGGMKDVLDFLTPTIHRDTVSSPIMEKIAAPLRSNLELFPFHMPKETVSKLQSLGIDAHNLGYLNHPHPAHKTIENHILYNHWSNLARTPSTVCFMKPEKFHKLQSHNPNFSALLNYRLTARDTTRYPITSSSLPCTPTVFIHDAIMYMSPAQLAALFHEQPSVQTVYATVVIPPESAVTDLSINPELYRFRKVADQLIYELEGNPASSYTQPISALTWLQITTIHTPNFSLSVSILDSWGANHSLLIQRGLPPVHHSHDTHSFKVPDAILLPEPAHLNQPIRHRLVPTAVYQAVLLYVRAVRTLRTTDPAGFVRTQQSKAEYSWVTSAAWDNLAHFALLTCSHRPNSRYFLYSSSFSRLVGWIHAHRLALLTISTPPSSALLGLTSFSLARFYWRQISTLVLFRFPIISPPTSFLSRLSFRSALPPLFKLQTVPRPVPWRLLPSLSMSLLSKFPVLRRFFSDKPIPSWFYYVLCSVSSIPLLLLSLRKFCGPDSPQALLDNYTDFFHSKPWTLTLDRAPVHVRPSSFIPIESLPPQAPQPLYGNSDHLFHPAETPTIVPISNPDSEPFPPPTPIPELPPFSPKKPVPSVSKPPTSQEPAVSNPPAPSSPQPPSTPSTPRYLPPHKASEPKPLQVHPLPPPSPPVRIPQVGASGFVAQDLPAQELPLPTLSCELVDLDQQPSTPPSPPPASPSPLVTDDLGTVSASRPKLDPTETTFSELVADPSASGPVSSFSELYPNQWCPGSATFPARVRNSSHSTSPYPGMDCLLKAISIPTGLSTKSLWESLCATLPDSFLSPSVIASHGLNTDHFCALAHNFSLQCHFHSGSNIQTMGLTNASHVFHITHDPPTPLQPGHFTYLPTGNSVLTGAFAEDLAQIALMFRVHDHLLPFRTVHTYRTHPIRAKNLVSNMKNGFDGVMASADPQNPKLARERILSLDGVLDIATPRSVRLIHIAGFPGCGKTYPITRLLSHPSFRNFRVAVPTVELRSEWKDMLKLKPAERWRIGTWESSLLKSARVLVIDEIYKMPRGYLDLAIHSDSSIQFVIVLGDPLQGEYHSTSPDSSNSRLSPETSHLSRYIDFYCLWSHRVPHLISGVFQVPTSSSNPGFVSHHRSLPPNSKILTCSQSSAKTLLQCGYSAVTIASSQGSTYEGPACIHLDRNSRSLSDSHSFVAVTRSKKGIIFTGDLSLLDGSPSSNRIFSAVFQKKSIPLRGLFSTLLPQCPLISAPLKSRNLLLSGAGERESSIFRVCSISHTNTDPPTLQFLESLPPCPLAPIPSSSTEESKASHAPMDRIPFPIDILSQEEFGEDDPYSKGFGIRAHTACVTDASSVADVVAFAPLLHDFQPPVLPQVSTHFLPETRRPLHQDVPSALPEPVSVSPVTHSDTAHEPVYPSENFENLVAHFLPPRDPALREIVYQDQTSNQFPLLDQPFHLSTLPSSLAAAIHSSKQDPTLLPASIGKRLRFRPSNNPYHLTAKDEFLGGQLFEGLCRAYHRNPNDSHPFDPILFAECINLNEYAQLTSKSQSTIIANARRSDPDWRYTAVRIFSKTQHKVNEGSLFADWKACQTLALMHDAVILLLGPVKKYQRHFDARDRPATIYIHAGHTPQDMSKWCQQHLSNSIHVANDYSSFDQSQHGEAVVLERLKMQRLSIPTHLIDLHVHLKCNVSTQFGPLTCMRLTGEPGTYDDNSDYNLAVICLQYALGTTPVMISGDDSLIDSLPPPRDNWPALSNLLALRFKTEFDRYSLFCGYFVGPAGAIRAPRALFAKLAIAVDDGSIRDKMESYLSEFVVGHSIGDSFWTLLPLPQIPYQSACFDFFCRNAPPHLKVAFRIGEIPLSVLEVIFENIKWASHATYSMLSSAARFAVVKFRQSRSFPEDPEVSKLQGHLRDFF